MNWRITVITILSAVALVEAVCLSYQIYQIVKIDAKARGLKHPKFWGFFATSNNNGGGLIPYLIGRRKYPIIAMSDDDTAMIAKRKKVIGAALIFLSASTVGLVLCIANIFLLQ